MESATTSFLFYYFGAESHNKEFQVSFFLGNGTDLYVTWITFDETFKSLVEYGENDLNLLAEGTSVYFVDEGEKRIRRYVHRVTLKSLKPGVTYRKLLKIAENLIIQSSFCFAKERFSSIMSENIRNFEQNKTT